jgi:hypothetical protein
MDTAYKIKSWLSRRPLRKIKENKKEQIPGSLLLGPPGKRLTPGRLVRIQP